MERTIVERYLNGSMALTTIKQFVVVYDVWLVGQRGWRKVVPIKPRNWKERQWAATEQDRIASRQ